MYEDDELEYYYSISIVRDIFKSNENIQLDYCIVLCWLFASSHPAVRDRVTRILFHILEKNTSLINKLIEKFDNVNDLYVLERLYCAIYGVVLIVEDQETISVISRGVYNKIFENKKPPCHLHLRSWALKILERAKYLNIEEHLFNDSLPPYNSDLKSPADLDYKKLLGESDGSEKIYQSVFGFEDFARYIIGTNSNVESRSFTKHLITEEISTATNFLPLLELQKILLLEIHDLGWNDKLGDLDKGVYSYNRHENKTERIGKKYQWLALYSITAKLLDKYKICDSWNQTEIYKTNFPWLTRYNSYFDPTIPIPELKTESIEIEFEKYELPKITSSDGEEWIKSNEELVEPYHFEQIDSNGQRWILLSTYQSISKEISPFKLEYFLRYDSLFIKNNDIVDFEKWAREQNFYGRWMPEYHDQYEYFLFEYPWSDSYKSLKIENTEHPRNGCPCEVIVSTESQLQENWNGIKDDISGSTLLPNHEMMNELKLKTKRERGAFYNDANEIVAISNYNDDKGKKGLYVRQDILDDFMRKNDFSLVYCIIGEKKLRKGSGYDSNVIMKDISGSYKYSDGIISPISKLRIFER